LSGACSTAHPDVQRGPAQGNIRATPGQTPMKLRNLVRSPARKARDALRNAYYAVYRKLRRPLPGEYQPYSYTRADRYPWLFEFAAARLGSRQPLSILSFGCSRGDEVFSLRRYFPGAALRGLDVNPRNIARCLARLRTAPSPNTTFAVAANTAGEPTSSFDAIFCLAVLINGDLTTAGAQRCDPVLTFERFDRLIADFARCLKPGGLLILHATNFRFCDTGVARDFDVVLEAGPEHLAPDVIFDRDNRLMLGERARYRAVAFQKR
jgi:SAM-dependent methyltransferase